MQSGALRRLVAHAYDNVPYYRAVFDRAGIDSASVRSREDLLRLPILERDSARESFDSRQSVRPPVVEIRKSTGGTTGEPLRFGYDLDSEVWRQATKLRGYAWAGYEPGDRAFFFWGAAPKPANWTDLHHWKVRADRSLKREVYMPCDRLGDDHLSEVVGAIERTHPKVILCYARAGAALARFVNRSNRRAWGTIPVICGAEQLMPADRNALEEAFGDAVFETYGCREVMLIGAECDRHDGLHVSEENLIVEIVVRDAAGRQRPAEPGETGEVIVTDLHNLGMPFIRYATGDRARWHTSERCGCGRALRRLASVDGRIAETLRDGRGRDVNALVFNIIFTDMADRVAQFQAVQKRDGSVTLKVVPARPLAAADREAIVGACSPYFEGTTFRVEIVDDIPTTSSGKRHVVLVER